MFYTLTREQFEEACRRYVDSHSDETKSGVKTFSSGWSWHEHPFVARLGYLSRTVVLPRTHPPASENDGELAQTVDTTEDECVATPATELLTCKQYIIYSPTFEVPAFYFTLHDSSGSPLSLDGVAQSTLFRRQALPSSEENTFALTFPDSSLALLSQGDHPTLGTPSWYFHPCHTSEVVGEILAESNAGGGSIEPLRWMEVWFMVLSNTVDLFAGSEWQ
ncbi:hypothetical protein BD413DRAFT_475413 [Trametes elegans]|nr:hypothetical protein BD413DRAFT_475413 [Trametes elegans]